MQGAVFKIGLGQDNGAGHQGHAELLGQATEQLLVIFGHTPGLHAQARIFHAVFTLGAQKRSGEFQRVAQGQPVHGFFTVVGAVQLVFLAAGPQPGAHVLGQHHNGLGVEQTAGAGLLEVRRQLAMQAGQALVVARKQLWLDAQQIAPVGGNALIQGDLDAQVGEVMADGPVRRPCAIAKQSGQGEEGDEENQEFAHGAELSIRQLEYAIG
ncbi:hypothetical protein D9M73_185670 [compost metagenome]